MIDLYSWSTPNGYKVQIMLEETGLDYRLHPVDLGRDEQNSREFLAVNPNGKIPALVDMDGPGGTRLTIFESGAILLYLAEKIGRFLTKDPVDRWRTISWLMFQTGGVGPMLGQAGYFIHRAPEPVPAAVERFTLEAERLYRVVDGRLAESAFLGGDYSIADMACFPWMRNFGRFGLEIGEFPNVARWLDIISARPAVERALDLP
ncbi:MAG: glutathione S-transferase N-terminal domain-containing protein [Acidobacteriota bacterium]|nr:glutathione S-transferase N-terminal domain-containing protein [Acidobacteriota bacterium]